MTDDRFPSTTPILTNPCEHCGAQLRIGQMKTEDPCKKLRDWRTAAMLFLHDIAFHPEAAHDIQARAKTLIKRGAITLLILFIPSIANALTYRYVGDRNTKSYLTYFDEGDYSSYTLKGGEHGFTDIYLDTDANVFTWRSHAIFQSNVNDPQITFKSFDVDYTVPVRINSFSVSSFSVTPLAFRAGTTTMWSLEGEPHMLQDWYTSAAASFEMRDYRLLTGIGNNGSNPGSYLDYFITSPLVLQSPVVHNPEPQTWTLLALFLLSFSVLRVRAVMSPRKI